MSLRLTMRVIFLLAVSLLLLTSFSLAQESDSVPTLVPPTPLPQPDTSFDMPLQTVSTLATMLERGFVRVGVLYNEPPYSELSIRGEVIGYEADVARAIAELWEIDVEFVQVTRLNGIEKLQAGDIDWLMASTVHRRELDNSVEFSQTYRVGSQAVMVRAEDNAEMLTNLVNRNIAYVIGTEGERALQEWQSASGIPVSTQMFLTLDQAFSALVNQQVDAVVARRSRLRNVSANQPELIKLLAEPIQPESHAIALTRQDRHLRNMLNRTLQYLLQEGTLETLHNQYFPSEDFAFDALPQWANIGEDAPNPRQSPTNITYPTQYVVPRLQNDRTLRVAGLLEPPADASQAQRRVYDFHQSLLQAMVSRWNVNLQFVSGEPVDLLNNGQADIALGLPLDWQYVADVDFSAPYLLHGDRLMVPTNSGVESFNDLRGQWVGVLNNEEGAAERAQGWADSINVRINIYTTNENDAAFTLLVESNADVIYADSLKLIRHLTENPGSLTLTPRWYSREYMALALPTNDLDWRLLVDYTLQDMFRDGTLETLLQTVIPPNSDPPSFDVWYGQSSLTGF
jgi:ABC-type amino acid transport substrate-binding protein